MVYTDLVARHDEMFHTALAESDDGEILSETGDGFLIRFSDPSDAVNTALRLQLLAKHTIVDGQPIQIRIGIHLGVITEMEERIRGEPRRVGMAINLAARVMDIANSSQILMTRSVFDDARQYIRTHPPVEGWTGELPSVVWKIHGDYLFKGSDDPLAIFEVGAESIAALTPPGDGGKGRKVEGSGSDKVIPSLPAPPAELVSEVQTARTVRPAPGAIAAKRDKFEQAHESVQAEIDRLKESELLKVRKLDRESEKLAEERAHLDKLSAELAERKAAEERIHRELLEKAREEMSRIENRGAIVQAGLASKEEDLAREFESKRGKLEEELAAKEANLEEQLAAKQEELEKNYEAKSAELKSSAERRMDELEERERAIAARESELAAAAGKESEAGENLENEREKLRADREEFTRELESTRAKLEEERVEMATAREEELARVREEASREIEMLRARLDQEREDSGRAREIERTHAEEDTARKLAEQEQEHTKALQELERNYERKAAELKASAGRRMEALEERERAIAARENELAAATSGDAGAGANLESEREKLRAEREEFTRELESTRAKLEEERSDMARARDEELARVKDAATREVELLKARLEQERKESGRVREDERTRAEEESARRLAEQEREHSKALEELQATLELQQAELARQREEIVRAEEVIQARKEHIQESGIDEEDESTLARLEHEARSFASKVDELNEELARARKWQKKRLAGIAAAAAVLAVTVGFIFADEIRNFVLGGTAVEGSPVLDQMAQLEKEEKWGELLDNVIPAKENLPETDHGEVREYAVLALNKLAAEPEFPAYFADDPGKDPLALLEVIEERTGWDLPPKREFLVARTRLRLVAHSPRCEGMTAAIDAFRGYHDATDSAGTEFDSLLEGELRTLLEVFLGKLWQDDIPDEGLVRKSLESIAPQHGTRIRTIGLVRKQIEIYERLQRRTPPDIDGALVILDDELAPNYTREALAVPFEAILGRIEASSGGLPEPDRLRRLGNEWDDYRPFVVALDKLKPSDEQFAVMLTALWELHLGEPALPFSPDAKAWIAMLKVSKMHVDENWGKDGVRDARSLGGRRKCKGLDVSPRLSSLSAEKGARRKWSAECRGRRNGGRSSKVARAGPMRTRWRRGRRPRRHGCGLSSPRRSQERERRGRGCGGVVGKSAGVSSPCLEGE